MAISVADIESFTQSMPKFGLFWLQRSSPTGTLMLYGKTEFTAAGTEIPVHEWTAERLPSISTIAETKIPHPWDMLNGTVTDAYYVHIGVPPRVEATDDRVGTKFNVSRIGNELRWAVGSSVITLTSVMYRSLTGLSLPDPLNPTSWILCLSPSSAK